MVKIKQLADKGEDFFPITNTKAVYDDAGNRLDNTINTLNENLTQTPITKGDVTLSTIDDKLNYLIENGAGGGRFNIKKISFGSTTGVTPTSAYNFILENNKYSKITIGRIDYSHNATKYADYIKVCSGKLGAYTELFSHESQKLDETIIELDSDIDEIVIYAIRTGSGGGTFTLNNVVFE